MKIIVLVIINTFIGTLFQDYDNMLDLCVKMEWHISNEIPPEEDCVHDFLAKYITIGNNVEYREWANEILFALLEHFPKQTIIAMSNLNKQQKDAIFVELSNPINDGIDIYVIYRQLNSCEFKSAKHVHMLDRIKTILSSLYTTG